MAKELVRFGVSIEKALVESLDVFRAREGYANRSETLRNLIVKQLLSSDVVGADDIPVTGIITLVYPAGMRLKRLPVHDFPLLHFQANFQLHIDEDTVLKILVISGKRSDVDRWSSLATHQKKVSGQTVITSALPVGPRS